MSRHTRERATIDLRGIGPRLRARAAARGLTTAALVRTAIVAILDADGEPVAAEPVSALVDPRVVKVTLRLNRAHAACLADRARAVEMSQGAYVEGLLDGTPMSPRAMDHGDAVAALADSTQKVAAMSTDIHRFIRLLRGARAAEAEKYRAGLMSLTSDVRSHLNVASRLMASLTLHSRAGSSIAQRRARGTE